MPGSGSRRWVSSFQALAVLALVMALSSCKKETIPEVAEALNNKEAPEWVSHDKNRPNPVAVVFVHGIFGTTKGTWTNKEGVTFFDLIKKNPDIGSKIDVYAFGYTSDMFKEGSLDIYSAADKLDGFLMADKVWEYKTVVFVGHSMGGLGNHAAPTQQAPASLAGSPGGLLRDTTGRLDAGVDRRGVSPESSIVSDGAE